MLFVNKNEGQLVLRAFESLHPENLTVKTSSVFTFVMELLGAAKPG